MERNEHTSIDDPNSEQIVSETFWDQENHPSPEYGEVRNTRETLESLREAEGEFRVLEENGTRTWIQIEPIYGDENIPDREEQFVWFYQLFPNGRVSAETVLLRTEEEIQSGEVILNNTGELVQDDEGRLRVPEYQALTEEAENIRARMQELGLQHRAARLAGDNERVRQIRERFRELDQEAEPLESAAAPRDLDFTELPLHGTYAVDMDSVQPYLQRLSSSQPAENIPEQDRDIIKRFNGLL